jgi:hypothetical protein
VKPLLQPLLLQQPQPGGAAACTRVQLHHLSWLLLLCREGRQLRWQLLQQLHKQLLKHCMSAQQQG